MFITTWFHGLFTILCTYWCCWRPSHQRSFNLSPGQQGRHFAGEIFQTRVLQRWCCIMLSVQCNVCMHRNVCKSDTDVKGRIRAIGYHHKPAETKPRLGKKTQTLSRRRYCILTIQFVTSVFSDRRGIVQFYILMLWPQGKTSEIWQMIFSTANS